MSRNLVRAIFFTGLWLLGFGCVIFIIGVTTNNVQLDFAADIVNGASILCSTVAIVWMIRHKTGILGRY